MASITSYLSERLKLTVNQTKSAVDRPWKRTFLSYSMTWHRKPRLTVAEKAVARLKANLKTIFRRGRGKSIQATIEETTPKLRGWITYFRLLGSKRHLRGTGRMAAAETAAHSLEAVEAPLYASKEPDAAGIIGGDCMAVCHKRPRPLVECRGRAYEQSCSEILLRQTGTGITHEPVPPTSTCFMNRRVRNRTYGGVGGRRA